MLEQLDLIIQNLNIFNVHLKKFVPGHLAFRGERIFRIYPESFDFTRDRRYPESFDFTQDRRYPESFDFGQNSKATTILDGQGLWAIPGLIDIHLHIESSMVTPPFFAEALIRNGVTTAVADPHEIANVFGVEGIRAMIRASQDLDVDLFYQIPSCVPATELETAGAAIGVQELEELLTLKEMIALGEVMDFVDLIHNPSSRIRRLVTAARKHHLILEGHAPNLIGSDLAAYMFYGSDSDHTFQTIETLQHRIAQGTFIQIQEKSIYAETIQYLNQLREFDYFALVTDDVMADELEQRGHLNVLIREAIRQGLSPEKAIYAATFAPAQRMQLHDRGTLSSGKLADVLIVKDLESFEIYQVFKRGKLVQPPTEVGISERISKFPNRFHQSVHVEPLTTDQFRIPAPTNTGECTCRVMETQEHTTYTKEIHAQIPVVHGVLQWQNTGVCLAAVFERHDKGGSVGYGFATGTCLKCGAVATTYAHDSHNLLVLGYSPEEMTLAANTVIESQGGIVVVEGETIKAHLALPVAGIMAKEPVATVGQAVSEVKQALMDQGYRHRNVIMSLSTLTLPVSPELKLSDRGLIHVPTRSFVNLMI